MLDTSQCQKPRKRMNFPGIRSSKFRHVYGLPAKKDKCYENVRISRNAHDGNYCAVNPAFLAVVVEVGGGGSFVVVPHDRTGRIEYNVWKVVGHQGPVLGKYITTKLVTAADYHFNFVSILDVKWNPFDDNVIASASEDCRVRVWRIPQGGLVSDLHQPLVTLTGHRSDITSIINPMIKCVNCQEACGSDRVASHSGEHLGERGLGPPGDPVERGQRPRAAPHHDRGPHRHHLLHVVQQVRSSILGVRT